jgi:hypothetical protein
MHTHVALIGIQNSMFLHVLLGARACTLYHIISRALVLCCAALGPRHHVPAPASLSFVLLGARCCAVYGFCIGACDVLCSVALGAALSVNAQCSHVSCGRASHIETTLHVMPSSMFACNCSRVRFAVSGSRPPWPSACRTAGPAVRESPAVHCHTFLRCQVYGTVVSQHAARTHAQWVCV